MVSRRRQVAGPDAVTTPSAPPRRPRRALPCRATAHTGAAAATGAGRGRPARGSPPARPTSRPGRPRPPRERSTETCSARRGRARTARAEAPSWRSTARLPAGQADGALLSYRTVVVGPPDEAGSQDRDLQGERLRRIVRRVAGELLDAIQAVGDGPD